MPLYSCRSYAEGEYSITKLNEDLEPEATYLLAHDGQRMTCECPAGGREVCRHRRMLPKFLETNRVNTGWVFDFDNGGQWRQYVGPFGEPEAEPETEATEGYQPFASDAEPSPDTPFRRRF